MSADNPPNPPPATEISFPVEYQAFAGRTYNQDLKGRGFFAMQGDAAYRFTGTKRGVFSGGATELDFTADDITNVAVDGRVVRFSTTLGRSGKLKRPFVFFCRDPADASTIASLLPARIDEDFAASRDFAARLRELSGPGNPGLSMTNTLIGVNIAVFLVMAGVFGAGWFEVTDLTPYIRFGANNAAATTDGQWWRLVTCMFMHYGFVHLALNMWALFQTGHLVEKLLGRVLFTFTYFASGVGAGLLSLIWNGDKIWSVGASGAIFGVYGALLGYMLREKQALPRAVFQPLLKSTLTFAGYNLFYGFVHTGIDNAAHVGGLISGVLFGWLCALPLDSASRDALVGQRLKWAAVAFAVMVGIGGAAAPRYPYVVRDEIAWAGVVKGFSDQETDLLKRQNAELQRWRLKGDNAEVLAKLIEKDLAPFYAEFGEKIGALKLTPNRLTDHRRQALVEFAAIKAEGYRHLVRAVRERSPGELKEYSESEAKAAGVIQSLNAAKH